MTASARAAWLSLLRRLHLYIGLCAGPFIFIAALTGTLYVATPQLEAFWYASALQGQREGSVQPLVKQIAVARQAIDAPLALHAIRPAPEPGTTTRIMFADPRLGASESRAIFVDPVTLAIKGDMTVYGTSGILPLRQAIDYFHQSLLMGEAGRIWSELAASWMWVSACGGIALWWLTRPKRQLRAAPASRFVFWRGWHVTLGWLLLVGMLLFSITGLTWSRFAGENVNQLRSSLDWLTPQLNTGLVSKPEPPGPHAEHAMQHQAPPVLDQQPEKADAILQLARDAGLYATRIEIRPPRRISQAWTVTEINRQWPAQLDTVAIDAERMQITDRVRFADYPLVAKLTRWGVDFHMGVLFGTLNQLLLIAFGMALCCLIVIGYRLWWLTRPQPAERNPAATLYEAWLALGVVGRGSTLLIAVLLGLALPVMGISLLLFFVVDLLRWYLARRRATEMA